MRCDAHLYRRPGVRCGVYTGEPERPHRAARAYYASGSGCQGQVRTTQCANLHRHHLIALFLAVISAEMSRLTQVVFDYFATARFMAQC